MPRVSERHVTPMMTAEWSIENEYTCGDPTCDYQGRHREHIILGVDVERRGVYLGLIDLVKDRNAATFIPVSRVGDFLADYLEAVVEAVGSDSPEARDLLETANVLRMVDWGTFRD